MTHSLISTSAQLLLSGSNLFTVGELREKPSLVPQVGGVYAWWFSKAPPTVPTAGTAIVEERCLLYVGIAPRKPSPTEQGGTRTLRDRLLNHCRGPIGSSTLRRTLATLLASDLGLRLGRLSSGKIGMPGDDEAKLTDWMNQYARVNWVATAAPWEVEDHLIGAVKLPLNIRGSSEPFAKELSQLRTKLLISNI
jgi:hypothetical protein